jgi:acetyl esterase/lipase/lysophospholipase L1-like esterase
MIMTIRTLIFILLFVSIGEAQQVIPIYSGKAPGSENWNWQEAEMYSPLWETRVVYNVSTPTLTAYLPPVRNANGTAVIICPGGAFHALSIDSEGIDVAKWLMSRGVSAFVLKYRLVKTLTDDPVKEVSEKMAQGTKFNEDNARLIPLAIADGIQAVRYVRKHAAEYNVDPERIGIMGFSAGGSVAAGVVFDGKEEGRVDFAAPVYAYIPSSLKDKPVPEDAPPLFIAAATDDQLGLASHSVNLYDQWLEARRSAELHMYSKGGHGFGMRHNDLPSDDWIERFGDWLQTQGLLMQAGDANSQQPFTPQQVRRRQREAEERSRNDWANLNRFQGDNEKLGPPKTGQNRVVFMGNSITAGWIGADPDFFASKGYIDRGISGQTTPQMLLRFKQDVIDLQPNVVVILAGINDIAGNTGPMTPKATMDNISCMALLAKARGIKVILCSVLPAYDFPWRPGLEPAEKVVALNKMIKDFAHENKMTYLDYFSSLVDERHGMKREYANDEVHPTLKGYKVMEPLVEKAIDETLKRK